MQNQICSFKYLQAAGVSCEGSPHFWVSDDGSYQEEGQNKIKGRIWDKVLLHRDVHCYDCLTYYILSD